MIKTIFDSKILKFLILGGLNTFFAYSILVFFLYIDFHYTIATLIAAIISIFSGYILNKYLVFNSNKSKNIFLYYIYWFVMYNINILIQFILLDYFISKNLYLNSLVSTLLVTILNFFINKNYFFKE